MDAEEAVTENSCAESPKQDEDENADTEECSQEIESTFDLKFCPPVYIQRYNRVAGVLQEETEKDGDGLPRTVFEVGCAELKMFKFFKSISCIEKVIMLDIDKELLESVSAFFWYLKRRIGFL